MAKIQTTTTTLLRDRQMLFPQRKPVLRNHFRMSPKLKSSPVRTSDIGKNACPPYWTCTELLLHLQLPNPTQPRLLNKLTIGSMQIRYVVTLYSVCYLPICSMFTLLIRMRKIFGILISSNILSKTSSDKGS